jgi:hypothetical protein
MRWEPGGAQPLGRRGRGAGRRLLSVMPAYFVSWGRYTQLSGLVVLPAACIAADRALGSRRGASREWVVAGVLGPAWR